MILFCLGFLCCEMVYVSYLLWRILRKLEGVDQ